MPARTVSGEKNEAKVDVVHINAIVIYCAGEVNVEACKPCLTGYGQFRECVSYRLDSGLFASKNTCANCSWKAQNRSCSWRKSFLFHNRSVLIRFYWSNPLMPDMSKALFGGEVDTLHFTKGTLVKSKGQRLRCEARCSYSSRGGCSFATDLSY